MNISKTVAFIPLRGGGKRVGLIDGKDKERADLGGHPLMAWTIASALDSRVFDRVIAITRSPEHAELALRCGCHEVLERPAYTTRDFSPDIEWVLWALDTLKEKGPLLDMYSILRVTSPFRTAGDIISAWASFQVGDTHSLRTVTPVEQHPGKMWVINHDVLLPLMPFGHDKNPWHSSATQSLFKAYIQTAGMEMAWVNMTLQTKTIAGSIVRPYIVEGWNALDINTKFDWYKAEQAVLHGMVAKPKGLR